MAALAPAAAAPAASALPEITPREDRRCRAALRAADVHGGRLRLPDLWGDNLLLTNLTGHPAVVLPSGFRYDGTPVSITFLGKHYGEAELLAMAKAYQDATGFHLRHPVLSVPAPAMPSTGT